MQLATWFLTGEKTNLHEAKRHGITSSPLSFLATLTERNTAQTPGHNFNIWKNTWLSQSHQWNLPLRDSTRFINLFL